MAEHKNPFFLAAERSAEAYMDMAEEVKKARVPDWTKEFVPMATVRKRLERASSNEERRAIRQEIQKMPDGETKMRQLLAYYRRSK